MDLSQDEEYPEEMPQRDCAGDAGCATIGSEACEGYSHLLARRASDGGYEDPSLAHPANKIRRCLPADRHRCSLAKRKRAREAT